MMSPIFIVGVPRSGTTLLQCLLSTSPKTYSLPETHFFSTILPTLNYQFIDVLTPQKLKEALELINKLMDLQFTNKLVMQLEDQAHFGTLTGKILFEIILETYRPPTDIAQTLRVIEKTPLHLEYIPEILTHYPTAKIIHIIRDPRNTISSWMHMPFAPTQWLLWYTQYWNFATKLTQQAIQQWQEKIHLIRYEDLIDNPQFSLQKICQFLDLEFKPSILMEFTQNNPNHILSTETWKSRNQEKTIFHEKMPWTKRLTQEEAGLIEQFCGKNMQYYGYHLQAKAPFPAKASLFLHNILYVRSNPNAQNVTLYLINRCNQTGYSTCGRWLAFSLLISKPRFFCLSSIRKAIGFYA